MSATCYYVFSHIHGNFKQLNHLFDKVTTDTQEKKIDDHHIIILGDFIDYGSSAKAILNYLQAPHDYSDKLTVLAGDHEHMLLGFIESTEDGPLWFTHGGLNTLHSYGIECFDYSEAIEELHIIQKSLAKAIPDEHLTYLRKLKLFLETDDFIFSHAGMNTNLPAQENSLDELIWGEADTKISANFDKCLVHVDDQPAEIQQTSQRISLPGAKTRRLAGKCYVIQKGKELRQL